MLLKIDSKIINGKGKLSLSGALDISTVEALRLSLEYFQGLDKLDIDLGGVIFIDSTGIAGIIDSVQALHKMKINVLIKNIPNHLFEVLIILGVPELCGSDVFEFPKGLTNMTAKKKYDSTC